jgi:hypothetical protein
MKRMNEINRAISEAAIDLSESNIRMATWREL